MLRKQGCKYCVEQPSGNMHAGTQSTPKLCMHTCMPKPTSVKLGWAKSRTFRGFGDMCKGRGGKCRSWNFTEARQESHGVSSSRQHDLLFSTPKFKRGPRPIQKVSSRSTILSKDHNSPYDVANVMPYCVNALVAACMLMLAPGWGQAVQVVSGMEAASDVSVTILHTCSSPFWISSRSETPKTFSASLPTDPRLAVGIVKDSECGSTCA